MFSFRLWQSSGCKSLNGLFFNPLSVKISVETQTNFDPPDQKLISKFFHNKAIAFPFEFTKSFFKILEPQFLLDILGPAGIILILFAIIETFKNKNKFGFGHLFIVIAAFLISLTSIPPKKDFLMIVLSSYSFSLWGIKPLSLNRLNSFLFVMLIFLTIWFFIINWQMPKICNEIFFN